jgi:hypothetical protein
MLVGTTITFFIEMLMLELSQNIFTCFHFLADGLRRGVWKVLLILTKDPKYKHIPKSQKQLAKGS